MRRTRTCSGALMSKRGSAGSRSSAALALSRWRVPGVSWGTTTALKPSGSPRSDAMPARSARASAVAMPALPLRHVHPYSRMTREEAPSRSAASCAPRAVRSANGSAWLVRPSSGAASEPPRCAVHGTGAMRRRGYVSCVTSEVTAAAGTVTETISGSPSCRS